MSHNLIRRHSMQHRFSALSQYLIYSHATQSHCLHFQQSHFSRVPMHSTQSHVSPLYTISFLPTLHNLLAYYAHNLIRHHALHAMAFLSTITKSHLFLRHTISMSPLPTISFLPTLPHLSPLRTISLLTTPHNLICLHSMQCHVSAVSHNLIYSHNKKSHCLHSQHSHFSHATQYHISPLHTISFHTTSQISFIPLCTISFLTTLYNLIYPHFA